jgi:AcrR family transcriptional regulator
MKSEKIISRRDENSDSTRQALIVSGLELFTTVGYQETGVEAVAQRARVTRGAFYHHFVDKKALLEAVVVMLQSAAAERLMHPPRVAPKNADRLRVGIEQFLEICVEPSYQRIVLQEAPAVLGAPRCREIADMYAFGLFTKALEGLQASGDFVCSDVSLAARMIGAMVCEAALFMTGNDNPALVKEQACKIVVTAVSAFRPGKSKR